MRKTPSKLRDEQKLRDFCVLLHYGGNFQHVILEFLTNKTMQVRLQDSASATRGKFHYFCFRRNKERVVLNLSKNGIFLRSKARFDQ